MAITIQSNPTALGAQSNLNIANNKLSKTISQLSSGLRINSAADDASGLAVSEKLRSQISGLSKAASNAQDGISMLQTAEGAMGSMTSIIQRMRELSVQAGDPAYTTNDRAMLQLEVDQLKEEINRVSSSTEFNTKKLLNGDAAALWSSSNSSVEAIVRSSVAEGNYAIETALAGGANAIYKTNVMSMKDTGGTVPQYQPGVKLVETAFMAATNGSETPRVSVQVAQADGKLGFGNNLLGIYESDPAKRGVTDMAAGAANLVPAQVAGNGYYEFEVVQAGANLVATAGGTTIANANIIKVTYTDAISGKSISGFTSINSSGQTANAVTVNAAGAYVYGAAGLTLDVNADGTDELDFTAAFQLVNTTDDVERAKLSLSVGDKFVLAVNQSNTLSAQDAAYVTIATGNGGVNGTGSTIATAGLTVAVQNAVDPRYDKTNTYYTAQLDTATGKVTYGNMQITLEKGNSVINTGAIGTANALTLYTQATQSYTTIAPDVIGVKGANMIQSGPRVAAASVAITTAGATGAVGNANKAQVIGEYGDMAVEFSAMASATSVYNKSGYVIFEAVESKTAAASNAGVIKATFVDALTGKQYSNTFKIDADGSLSSAGTIKDDNGIALATFGAGDAFFATTFTKGSVSAVAVTPVNAADATATSANIKVNTGDGGTLTQGGAYTAGAGSQGYTIRVPNAVSDTKVTNVTLYTLQMDFNAPVGRFSVADNIKIGTMEVQFDKASNVKTATVNNINAYSNYNSTTKTFGVGSIIEPYKLANTVMTDVNGQIANLGTKLSDIKNFYNADGRNVVANTQELTFFGNNKQATISIEGSDTLGDLQNKLIDAIVNQLGMGTGDAELDKNLVRYVTDPVEDTNEAVPGTFIIQTGLLGQNSELSVVADQGVINALGMTNIQKSQDASLSVTVKDAHSGELIGSDVVTDNMLRGVIKGADIKVSPQSGSSYNLAWSEVNKKLEFRPITGVQTAAYVHLKNNSTQAAIGANEGQTIDLSIGRMDTTALEIDDVNVVSFENAQKSITKLDMALERLSKSRAVIGAQMNRLDYTISNLNTARENMSASESRIRDLDIAQASTELAARQVMLQSATAMLAQANQLPSYASQLLR